MKKALAVTMALLAFTGCQTARDIVDYNEGATALVIQYGTMKAIQSLNEIDADEVIAFVDRAESLIEDNEVTLDDAFTLTHAEIPWEDFTAETALVIDGVFLICQDEVTKRVDVGQLDGDDIVRIKKILGYVRRGAELAKLGVSYDDLDFAQVGLTPPEG